MGHFCQIERVRFIRDGSSQCYRKGIFGFLEFLGCDDSPHGNDFGTSIPMVPAPGIGAMIRMPKADKLNAMSSSRFLIFEIFIPGAGTISYNVTVGPMVALILVISIL